MIRKIRVKYFPQLIINKYIKAKWFIVGSVKVFICYKCNVVNEKPYSLEQFTEVEGKNSA